MFIGVHAGRANIDGRYNAFVGYQSGSRNINGIGNTFFGYKSGRNNISGRSNTFIGYKAGFTNTSGTGNLVLKSGYTRPSCTHRSGGGVSCISQNDSPGNNNVLIGSFSMEKEKQLMTHANYMWIQNHIEGNSNEQCVSIHHDLLARDMYAFLQSPSDIRLKHHIKELTNPLVKLSKLKAYQFEWKDQHRGQGPHMGFIAQHLLQQKEEQLLSNTVKQDKDGFFSVNYVEFIPLIVSAVQKLWKQVREKLTNIQQLLHRSERDIVHLKNHVNQLEHQMEQQLEEMQTAISHLKTKLQDVQRENQQLKNKTNQSSEMLQKK